MDYVKIYNKLMSRALHREIDNTQYYESHHIIPRCLGGGDVTNIARLTAGEHYVAHQLLVKIFPLHHGLIKAAVMMTCSNSTQGRSTNKLYSWLRRKHSGAMSESQTGNKNSQFGKIWVYSDTEMISKKIHMHELNILLNMGWKQGRVIDFSKMYIECCICSNKFRSGTHSKTCGIECSKILKNKGRAYAGREDEYILLFNKYKSMNRALKEMGFVGAMGQYYIWAKSLS